MNIGSIICMCLTVFFLLPLLAVSVYNEYFRTYEGPGALILRHSEADGYWVNLSSRKGVTLGRGIYDLETFKVQWRSDHERWPGVWVAVNRRGEPVAVFHKQTETLFIYTSHNHINKLSPENWRVTYRE